MDLPLPISERPLAGALAAVLDVEGKIAHAIETLGPVADRDVLLLDAGAGLRQADLVRLGARVRPLPGIDVRSEPLASADIVIAFWTWLGLGRAAEPDTLTGLSRLLRPTGRLLLVEDYGRDDTTHLYADADREARLTAASDRRGAMLAAGFKVRVLHCFWTFADLEAAAASLTVLFPDTGATFAAGLRRPRISHKVAVYHRSFD